MVELRNGLIFVLLKSDEKILIIGMEIWHYIFCDDCSVTEHNSSYIVKQIYSGTPFFGNEICYVKKIQI